MYDPLQASDGPPQTSQTLRSSSSPPATPSKTSLTSSRIISARPPPLQQTQRPVGDSVTQSHTNGLRRPQALASNSLARSQSPLAPRPPLPGQAPRPVSPSHYQQQHPVESQSEPFDTAVTYSEAAPNAWANDDSPIRPDGNIRDRRGAPPAPEPLPLPSPVKTGFTSPTRLNSPGPPRSPVAGHNSGARAIQDEEENTANASISQVSQSSQKQRERPVPFVRIRVIGTDRAKKEMGIKMDATTNISTYHRHITPVFSRTYHEFSLLHSALAANHPETILPALPLPQTSASTEEEEDRFLKSVFQKFMDRITRDKALVLDDELRGFVEADFGYTPLTKAKKLKSSSGFLSRSTSKPTLLHSEGGEPDFLLSSKIHSAALETALHETTKSLDREIKANVATATASAEVSTSLTSFATTESFLPLSNGIKSLADTIRTVAELEVGQSNSSALILGDSLAYSTIEARSAKDALLQRQYNVEELNAAIKSTINRKRNIEKLKSSLGGGSNSSAKTDKVNEALDELDEAIKHENQLQTKVLAISNNLRPSLQNHLKLLNHELLVTMLNTAKTNLAYEGRKLQLLESVHDKITRIPEKSTVEATVHYHQPTVAGVPAGNAHGPLVGKTLTAKNDEESLSDSTATVVQPQSKFLATQAQIRAQMEQQAQQSPRQSASASTLSDPSVTVSRAPANNPFRNDTSIPPPRSSSISPSPSSIGSQATSANISQSMFLPPSQATLASPPRRYGLAQPQSPTLNRNTSATQVSTGDPLATTSAGVATPSHNGLSQTSNSNANGPMAQSVFLPGKNANLPPAGRAASNPLDERKRADARKAASLLAGAF